MKNTLFCLALPLLFVSSIYAAQENRFTGGDWWDVNNWSDGHLPNDPYQWVEIEADCNMPADATLIGLGIKMGFVNEVQFNVAGTIDVYYDIEYGYYCRDEQNAMFIIEGGSVKCQQITSYLSYSGWVHVIKGKLQLNEINADEKITFIFDQSYLHGPNWLMGDLDGKGCVNFRDLAILANNWLAEY